MRGREANYLVFSSAGPGSFLGEYRLPRPDYSIGDLRYLRANQTHPVQIRPILSTDMLAGVEYGPGMRMIVLRLPNGKGALRPIVRLPRKLRENTTANADAAWRIVLASLPGLAEFYDVARNGPERPPV